MLCNFHQAQGISTDETPKPSHTEVNIQKISLPWQMTVYNPGLQFKIAEKQGHFGCNKIINLNTHNKNRMLWHNTQKQVLTGGPNFIKQAPTESSIFTHTQTCCNTTFTNITTLVQALTYHKVTLLHACSNLQTQVSA